MGSRAGALKAAKIRSDRAKAAKAAKGDAKLDAVESRNPVGAGIRVTPKVREARPVDAAPSPDLRSDVPLAGSEPAGGVSPAPAEEPSDVPATTSSAAPAEVVRINLDPKTVTAVLKGAFGLVSTITKEDHWKADDEEVEGVVEPLCRQLVRIPIVNSIGQDAADLIVIGTTLGTIVYMRIQESIAIRARKQAALQESAAAAAGETRRQPFGGDLHQETREPARTDNGLGRILKGYEVQ